jgi:hypothetical protein
MKYVNAIIFLVLMQVGCATAGNSEDLSPYLSHLKTLSVEDEKYLSIKGANNVIGYLTSYKSCIEKSLTWLDINKCDKEKQVIGEKFAQEMSDERHQLLLKTP